MFDINKNTYLNKNTYSEMNEHFVSGKWKEDCSEYMANLFHMYMGVVRRKDMCVVKLVMELSTKPLTTIEYEFLKEVILVVEDENTSVNFKKYDELIVDVIRYSVGKLREPLISNTIRNQETEFAILLKRLDVPGVITLLELLSRFRG